MQLNQVTHPIIKQFSSPNLLSSSDISVAVQFFPIKSHQTHMTAELQDKKVVKISTLKRYR